jgi:hypothetical protein
MTDQEVEGPGPRQHLIHMYRCYLSIDAPDGSDSDRGRLALLKAPLERHQGSAR